MKTETLGFLFAATLVALPAAANAMGRGDDARFCKAIGLASAQQADCAKQISTAKSLQERNELQAAWVSRSALMDRNGSVDVQDRNTSHGVPATTYQSKVAFAFVPNRTSAEINRALNTATKENAQRAQLAAKAHFAASGAQVTPE